MPKFGKEDSLVLRFVHDEDLRIFINRRPLYEADGFARGYREILVSPEKRSFFLPEPTNIIAVSCHDTWGSRAVDVGVTLYSQQNTSPDQGNVGEPGHDDIETLPRKTRRATQPALPKPVCCWTFDTDTRDSIGNAHRLIFGSASVQNGRLQLNGKNSYVRTNSLPTNRL